MFTLMDRQLDRNCQGFARREFLRIGSLALGNLLLPLGGLSLPGLLAARARAAVGDSARDKSVVLLFLQGGPPHIELFDPKMTAPSGIRSITGEVQTTIPGVTFGGTFPKLAALANKLSIVRSYGSKNGDHSYLSVVAAGNPRKAAASAIYTRLVGTNHPSTGLPRNVLVLPEAIDQKLKLRGNFETGAMPTLTAPGDLGMAYGAFNPSGGGELQKNMEMKIAPERLGDRRSLLAHLDQLRRRADNTRIIEGIDRFQQQAFEVVTRGIASAFDLSQEDPRTLERYDTSSIFRMEELNRWYDMHRVTNLLGHQMLLARRLCEAGCGFVTVSDCGWDYHANGNSPKGMTGIWPMGHQVDHAVSAFIEDVEERGLSDKILLVVTGEMGRSPRINRDGGRDHFGELTSLLISGGGLRMGQIIGQSDRTASRPLTTPYAPQHLLATILHTLFDIGKLRLESGAPRDIVQLAETGQPIQELFG